jgi:uncharacterized protein (TIGR02284 family)
MIRPNSLDECTTERIQHLIRTVFAGRDDLYAAADTLDNERIAEICRRLAQELGGHAAELQQLVLLQGREPAKPETVESRLQRAVLELMKSKHGNEAVVAEVETSENQVKRHYEEAIDATPNREVKGVLRRHRDDAQFGEDVLHELRSAAKK